MLLDLNFSNVPIMDNIIEPNESFDFSKLTLALPTSIQGGAYFTKMNHLNKPIYIQTTKSLTKQGIIKTGKKFHCDLMFDNNSEILINWFEKLESKCQQLIYEKSEAWFQSKLELSDIETAFNSIIRIYKSGKYYLVRTNIKNNSVTNMPIIKIFDENQNNLSIDDVTSDSNIISILEIQGIKFTNRNFQIEMELKQVMIINNEPIFENCLIKTGDFKNNNVSNVSMSDSSMRDLEKEIIDEIKNKNISNTFQKTDFSIIDEKENSLDNVNIEENILENVDENTLENVDENTLALENNLFSKDNNFSIDTETHLDNDNDNVELDFEELNEFEIDNNKDLKEVDLSISLDNDLETMTLKKPNEVYYEKYKEARNKAKDAKKKAIIAYLEAKNIKKLYMLDELDYSDNEIDNEIEEVSESQLEGL